MILRDQSDAAVQVPAVTAERIQDMMAPENMAFRICSQEIAFIIAGCGKGSAVCFEAEYYPNAINYGPSFVKPIVKAGQTLCNHIRYHLNENRDQESI